MHRYCEHKTDRINALRNIILFSKSLHSEKDDELSASCRKECPLESYFSEKFVFDSTTLYWEPDYTLFRFYFRDVSTLNISQIPKTDPFTFLNNIGGGLGLFMGIAFPNLIEFFQFFLEIVLIVFIRKIN